jgi:hypothetical protein
VTGIVVVHFPLDAGFTRSKNSIALVSVGGDDAIVPPLQLTPSSFALSIAITQL